MNIAIFLLKAAVSKDKVLIGCTRCVIVISMCGMRGLGLVYHGI